MTPRLIEIDGIKRPLMQWAKIAGINTAAVYARMKKGMGVKEAIFAPKKNNWQNADEHDSAVDALCESGEPDRRVIVYAMVCCGRDDQSIVEETGYDAAEVARFREECPEYWGRYLGNRWEFKHTKEKN